MKTKVETITYMEAIRFKNALDQATQLPFEQIKDLPDKDDYLFHLRFVKALNDNKKALEKPFETIKELEKPSKEYEEYATERNKYLAEIAKKDEEGNPIQTQRTDAKGNIVGVSYNIPGLADPKSENSKKLEKFDAKYKDIRDANKKKEDELQELLEDTVEVKFTLFKESLIPKGLTSDVLSVIANFIDWEGEEEEEKEEKKPAKK